MHRSLVPSLLSCAALLALAACGDDDAAGVDASLRVGAPLVLRDGVDPAAGAVTLEVQLINDSGADARQLQLMFDAQDEAAAGVFALAADLPTTIDAGQTLTVPVTFTPRAGAPSGCGLAAITTLQVGYLASAGKPRSLSARLLVSGRCDAALRCAPAPLNIPSTVLGQTTRQELTCVNTGEQAATISAAALGDDLDGQLKLELGGLPRTLARGESVSGALIFSPVTRGEYATELTITAGEQIVLPVVAAARRVRPLCADPAPQPPALPADIDGYTFKLESDQLAAYQGVVSSVSGVSEGYAPMLDSAMLLATGSYLDEFCKISHSGASWRWEGVRCQEGEGTLFNVIPIALSAQIKAELASVKQGDEVRVEGFDIERIEREGYWSDGGSSEREGNHAMFVSRVCDLSE